MFLALSFVFAEALFFFLTLYVAYIPPFYFQLQVAYALTLAYAIVRYRLMDINLIMRYASIYLLFAVTLAIPYSFFAMIFHTPGIIYLSTVVTLLTAPAVYKKMIGSFRRFVDKLPPFRGRYQSLAEIPGLQKAISSSANVKQWANKVVDSLNRLLEIENAAVFIYDDVQNVYLATAVRGADFGQMHYSSPSDSHPIISLLKKSRKIVQRDYLEHEAPLPARADVSSAMDLIKANLCIPFFNGGQMIGFASVGRKLKRRGTTEFKSTHFNLSTMRDMLEDPLIVTENKTYINGFLSSELALNNGRDPNSISAENLADTFNRLVGRRDWVRGLPFPDALDLRSEGATLLNRLRFFEKSAESGLNSIELAVLNAAVLAATYRPGLINYDAEDAFNEEDLRAVWGLVQGAEASLMVILTTLAGQMKSAEWAHDLRHPFTKGSFRLLDDLLSGRQGPLTTKQAHTLRMIQSDALFVQKHITDIVTPETSGELKNKVISATELMKSVESRYRYVSELSGIQFKLTLPETDTNILCDTDLIHYRVFNNLLDNALRYTPKGGLIEVGYVSNETQVHCFVKNVGGPPIESDLIPHLFERGSKKTNSSRGDRGLAGLGLFNVSQVVKAHRGHLEVQSSTKEGTVFEFTLPAAV